MYGVISLLGIGENYIKKSIKMKHFIDIADITIKKIVKHGTKFVRIHCVQEDIRAINPYNPASKHTYKGENQRELYLGELEKMRSIDGYIPELRFLTKKQAEKYGGEVEGPGEDIRVYIPGYGHKFYTVYNYSRIKWSKKDPFKKLELREWKPTDSHAMGLPFIDTDTLKIMVGYINPSYVPHENIVYLPHPDYCTCKATFLECYFHEITHWTRNNIGLCSRGLPYPVEELVAELSAMQLLKLSKVKAVDGQVERMLGYLGNWLCGCDAEDEETMLEDAKFHACTAVDELASYLH